MTQAEFEKPLGELTKQWPNVYSTARVSLIWREVKDLDGAWWSKTVDYFVGYLRQPPLMPEILDQVSAERERLRVVQKKRERDEAERFFTDLSTSVNSSEICQGIISNIKKMGAL